MPQILSFKTEVPANFLKAPLKTHIIQYFLMFEYLKHPQAFAKWQNHRPTNNLIGFVFPRTTLLRASGRSCSSDGECCHNKNELSLITIQNGNKKAPLAGTTRMSTCSLSMFAKTSLHVLVREISVSIYLLSLFHFLYLRLILALGEGKVIGVILVFAFDISFYLFI